MGEIQSRSVNHCCGLKMQKPLRRLHCQKIFPKLLSKDKRTNFIGRLLPGKYAGLERVSVFSPSVKWPSNKSSFQLHLLGLHCDKQSGANNSGIPQPQRDFIVYATL